MEDGADDDSSTDTDAKSKQNSNTETKIHLNFELFKAWFDKQPSTTCKLYSAPVICDEQLRRAFDMVCSLDDNGVTSRALPN
jgi:hypothetical protein